MTKIRTLTSRLPLLQKNSNVITVGNLLSNALLPTELTLDVLKNYVSLTSASHSVFLYRCITTVTPSRVYKLLPLPHCLSVGGSESCVYAGFTRCWFNRWTDDRLSQQLRRQIHSPTLSRLPSRFFSACFVYIRLSLSRFLFHTHTISMSRLFFVFLVSAWHLHMYCLQTQSRTLSVSPFVFECSSWFYYKTEHNTVNMQIMISKLQ